MSSISNVVPFPRQFRVVPVEMPSEEPRSMDARPAVDHDGQPYLLEALLHGLTPDQLQTVSAVVPRSGQELWDEVVRRWPALADEIVAGLPKAG